MVVSTQCAMTVIASGTTPSGHWALVNTLTVIWWELVIAICLFTIEFKILLSCPAYMVGDTQVPLTDTFFNFLACFPKASVKFLLFRSFEQKLRLIKSSFEINRVRLREQRFQSVPWPSGRKRSFWSIRIETAPNPDPVPKILNDRRSNRCHNATGAGNKYHAVLPKSAFIWASDKK